MKNLLLLIVLFFTIAIKAQIGAKIEFNTETINYGNDLKSSDDSKRVFVFKNTGNQPLLIINATSTCGSTIINFPKSPITPGSIGDITVIYDMSPGPISKTIIVETNAVNKESGIVALRIKGSIASR